MRPETPYNPLDKRHLGESVADALLARPVEPLPPTDVFLGAGIYAIYYTGPYPLYEPVAQANREDKFLAPIYVGKAVPAGARKGGFGLDAEPGTVLYNRIREHAESVSQVANLELSDFACRYLVVDDIWIPLGESLLIHRFAPIWNKIVDGFGNHDPGSGRHGQKRSLWDELHPGRSWASKLQPSKKTMEDVTQSLQRHFSTHSPEG